MNCSAEKASRKWANGAFGRTRAAMVTVAAVLLLLGAQAGQVHAARGVRPAPWGNLFGDPPKPRGSVRRAAVPLPKPRPAEAPAAETGTPTGPAAAEPQAPQTGKPTEQAAPQPSPPPAPQASACRQALTEAIAIAPSIPDIHGAGGCGGEGLVRLPGGVPPGARGGAGEPAGALRLGQGF